MASPPVLLQLIAVSKRFDALPGSEHIHVLRDVTLEIARGESVAIVGPSGSGKSTLLNLIGTLDRPTSGQLKLDGQDLSQLDDEQLAAVRNREIGFIFQAHHLLPHCTVLENVLVPTLALPKFRSSRRQEALTSPSEIHKPKSKIDQSLLTSAATEDLGSNDPDERATKLLQRVGLGERMHHRPGQLSGGERQRVAVVRALINQPKLLLADEPTGALDRAAAQELAKLLVELNREQGVTLIVVTHALDLARQMGRVLELADGRLVQG